MTTDAKATFHEHPARAAALSELHARPPMRIPSERALILRFVFAFEQSYAGRDDALIESICHEAGIAPPASRARALQFQWRGLDARWERHNEFVTYTFISASGLLEPALADMNARLLRDQPGPLVAKLQLRVTRSHDDQLPSLDPRFACASRIGKGRALLQTSFTDDAEGAVELELACASLSDTEAGSLAQSVLELEMYRMLALLALPIARQVGAMVRDTETQLGALTRRLSDPMGNAEIETLYQELTTLSGRVEMEIAASTYRFSAARAYGALVEERLTKIGEEEIGGRSRVGAFLMTRLIPALRTCESMHLALQDLARRTARAADLIRTRIDLQLARQNVELLETLNQRTKLQTRLQQTVEGLSVAAVSYYMIGLLSYLVKGIHDYAHIKLDPTIIVGALVPVVVFGVWMAVSSIRRKHQLD
jgi:uncharacterized membrane-anchored protein